MTDDGIVTSDEDDNTPADTASEKPVKTSTQQRKPPAPEPVEDERPAPTTRHDSVPQNPLSVTPVERMPAMPE